MHRLIAWAAATVGVGLLSLPFPAHACSVCLAGDPRFSEHGATAQARGQRSAYLQVQGWRKQSGLLPHEDGEEHHGEGEAGSERNRSQRLDLFLSWTPLDRFTFTLDVPFARNRIEEIEGDESETQRLSGLGDISLTTSIVLWRDRVVLPATWIEGRVFLKAPTGRTGRSRAGFVDPHLQTGTGSFDYGLGLAVGRRLSWGSLYTSLFYRENREGDFDGLDYEYGDVWLWNGALEVPIGHALSRPDLEWLTLGVELNYRWAEHDQVEGDRFRDSGGAVLYATPSLRVRLPFGLSERPASLRLATQLPLTDAWLHGDQDEKEVWSVGLYLPF